MYSMAKCCAHNNIALLSDRLVASVSLLFFSMFIFLCSSLLYKCVSDVNYVITL